MQNPSRALNTGKNNVETNTGKNNVETNTGKNNVETKMNAKFQTSRLTRQLRMCV